jgi:DNA-binding transcriptional MerR regulator
MEELTISEVARLSGVRATTIRYYESINVLPQPRRANGRRRYHQLNAKHHNYERHIPIHSRRGRNRP